MSRRHQALVLLPDVPPGRAGGNPVAIAISHFTFSIIVMIPVMLGLTIGLMIVRGPEMALLIPLALSMVIMITAWTKVFSSAGS